MLRVPPNYDMQLLKLNKLKTEHTRYPLGALSMYICSINYLYEV